MKNKRFILSLIILIIFSSAVYLYSNDFGSSFGIAPPWKKSSTNVSLAVSTDNVGIGTTSPDGKLHIMTASAGSVTANSYMDDLVIESNDDIGINILCPNNKVGCLGFGDTDDNYVAGLIYSHSSNGLQFFVNNSTSATINSSNNLGIGTTSPSTKIHTLSSTAGTNTLQSIATFECTTTGVPLAGFGTKINLKSETDPNSAGNSEILAFYGAAIEDPTTGSEDGAFVIGTMTNGATATEKMRIQSDGDMVLQGSFNYGVDTEATDAYVVDLDPNLSAYTDGLIVYWDANNPNDGACTLRLTGGLAAKALKTQGHDDPPANYIEEDSRPGAMFNAGADYWILITPDANP